MLASAEHRSVFISLGLDKGSPLWYNIPMGNPDETEPRRMTLEIEERTYRAIRDAIFTRNLCGQAYGILDGFVAKLCNKIDKGETHWRVQKKT